MADRTAVTSDDAAIVLRRGTTSMSVHPDDGGRVGQITVDGQALLIDVPPPGAPPTSWGSFPMAPWAGRLRAGRFVDLDGTERTTDTNHRDADGPGRVHAIHGIVFDQPWRLDPDTPRDDTCVGLVRDFEGVRRWPFAGSARQRFEIGDDAVHLSLSVEAADRPFAAELGWHPWFRTPDRVEFTPTAMYERDRFGLPTGALVEPATGPWDDCFLTTEPVRLHYRREVAPVVTVTSDCDHVVVFDELDHATCVEPQSGPPDAFNLDVDPHVAAPDAPLTRSMTISWSPRPAA